MPATRNLIPHDAVTESGRLDEDRISLLALASTLMRHRVTIGRWMFAGALVLVLPVLFKSQRFAASASFVPQVSESRSGLASLAGQFGMALPGASPSQSADFYAGLLKSRALLQLIVADTFVVAEMDGHRISFMDLFEIEPGTPPEREEAAVLVLEELISASVTKPTGVVSLSVATEWPSVSLAIATALIQNVDNFNRRTRQSQASAERKFLETRLALSRVELRAAEDRLRNFFVNNKIITGSFELTLERDRLQRDVVLQQQVFTSLTQAYEDARIREVRDTPVLTIIDPPRLPTMPLPRGRILRGILGLLLGGFAGTLWILTGRIIASRRAMGDPVAGEFAAAVDDLANATLRPVRWMRMRLQTANNVRR